MMRFYVRMIVLPLVFFTLASLLIRTQVYDDTELRQLLLPSGCPMPCFLGIRPGVTMRGEGLRLLAISGWVQTAQPESIDGGREITLRYKWSGMQPDLINDRAELAVTYQKADPQLVTQVGFQVRTDIKIGMIHLILDKPSGYIGSVLRGLNIGRRSPASMNFEEYYENYHINLLTFLGCPIDPARLLNGGGMYVIYYDRLPNNTVVMLPKSSWKSVLRTRYCE